MKTSWQLYADLIKGLWRENPVFMQLLAMCPTLAVTTTAFQGFTMGIAVVFVLVLSGVVISSFRKLIPHQVRIATFTIIIATFVTITDLTLAATFPPMSKALGPYVPLIVVNCIILGRMEVFTSKHTVSRSFMDTLGMGLGFTLAPVILGSIRELLSSGAVFGYQILITQAAGGWFRPWVIMILPPGAFITLGILLAIINSFSRKS
jgi:electron transport complex protein RnfE